MLPFPVNTVVAERTVVGVRVWRPRGGGQLQMFEVFGVGDDPAGRCVVVRLDRVQYCARRGRTCTRGAANAKD